MAEATETVNVFDHWEDQTEEGVQEDARFLLLEPGYYSVAVRELKSTVSRKGQAMVTVDVSPCVVPEDPRTQSFRHRLTSWVMLPVLVDREAYRAGIAKKKNADPAMIDDKEVDEAWGRAKAEADSKLPGIVRTLLGEDRERIPFKKALVESGQVKNYAQASAFVSNAAKEALQELLQGTISIEGHTKVAYISQSKFGDDTVNKINNFLDALPAGQEYKRP